MKGLATWCLVIMTTGLVAQDVHFTQFPQVHLSYNPALTGTYEGGGIAYRSQWGSIAEPFVTAAAFGQTFFTNGFDKIGVGALAMHDEAGPGQLTSDQVWLSGSYHAAVSGFVIAVGVQPGVVRRNLKPVTYPAQYDKGIGQFNIALPGGEDGSVQPVTFFNMNLGFGVYREWTGTKLFLGQSLLHLLGPDYSLVSSQAKLPVRSVTSIILEKNFAKLRLQPALLLSQHAGASEMNLQSRVYFPIGAEANQVELVAGAGMRNNIKGDHLAGLIKSTDAAFVVAGATYKNAELSLAYDLNISGLNTVSNYRGAFELVLIWKNAGKIELTQVVPPCIRI